MTNSFKFVSMEQGNNKVHTLLGLKNDVISYSRGQSVSSLFEAYRYMEYELLLFTDPLTSLSNRSAIF